MAVQIQLRNDTAVNWTASNPILAIGEIGIETDTDKFKIGNGSSAWDSLPYGGIQGPAGIDGQDGIDGEPGVVAATLPITYNSETKTVGFDNSEFSLEDINDVTITSPIEGQAITYDGSSWVNSQPQASGEKITSFLLMGA
jgi:hypothetical protein